MPTSSYTEQKKTYKNLQNAILEARVIANYGDPGLDEDYHFDILSQYVIVMIESVNRVPTTDKYAQMIAIVKRPASLWITASSPPNGSTASQQRMDSAGNVSVGTVGSFSTNGISRIYPPYQFGETIKIRKIASPTQPPDTFFLSAFNNWDSSSWMYGTWHTQGSTLPYFTTQDMKTQLQQKTIEPVQGYLGYYMGVLFKMQYEAFALFNNHSNNLVAGMTSIFNNTWNGNPMVYSANGGYIFNNQISVFNNQISVPLNYVGYEDMNVGGKARVASNECIPMVVTTPQSFPVPSSRAIGTIMYNPTYSSITTH